MKTALGWSTIGSMYGAAGSLISVLMWVYYSAQVVLYGAEFTRVYANRYGSMVKPSEDAMAITEEARVQQRIPRREEQRRAS